ncbi:MAG: LpxL/LpxP family acyltransferase, partial [Planctomycetota bacterium]
MIVYWIVRGFSRFLAWLPLGLVLAMGRGVGRFAYFVPRVRRKVVLQNLRYVFGDAPSGAALRDIARRAYEQLGMTAFEVLRAAGGGSHELCRQVTYSHVEPFRERRAAGQPLIILQSHF